MDSPYSDGDFDDCDKPYTYCGGKNFQIMDRAHVRARMKKDAAKVSSTLSVSMDEASILLRNYSWSVTEVTAAWLADESGVREKVGLVVKPVDLGCVKRFKRRVFTCGICFESFMSNDVKSAGCDHFYCKDCWSGYLSTSINKSAGYVCLRCPEPSCFAAVGEEIVGEERYWKCLVESYVEMNRKTKWCPGENCDRVVEILEEGGSFDIVCDCFASFCWNCNEEGHRPVDCETVKKWEDEEKRMAKQSLEKYTHYFERWDANRKSKERALADLKAVKYQVDKKIDEGVPKRRLDFITKAWLQVVECRRALQWSYAYGYYLPEDPVKKQFFEYLQGEAESGLEKLHNLTERGLQEVLVSCYDDGGSKKRFDDFQCNLISLTAVIRNHFENLVIALQNGLADVGSSPSSSKGARSYWSCDRCTFLNPWNAKTCQVCVWPNENA